MAELLPQPFWKRLLYTPLLDLLRGQIAEDTSQGTFFNSFGFVRRNSWAQLVSAANFPVQIEDHLTTVVKKTRLKSREKYDVAQELIAHFQDGLEAGVSTETLTYKFGNPSQAAKLIRRAKLRNRSLFSQVFRWVRLSFVWFCLFYLLAIGYQMMGQPTISVDYLAKVNATAKAVPENQRAWPLLRESLIISNRLARAEGLKEYALFPAWYHYETDLSVVSTDANILPKRVGRIELGVIGWKSAAAWLEKRSETLDLIRQASKKKGLGYLAGFRRDRSLEDHLAFGGTIESYQNSQTFSQKEDVLERALIGVHLEHVQSLRHFARMLSLDISLAADQGDAERVYENLYAQFKVADFAQETPFLVCILVDISVSGIGFEDLRWVQQHHPDLLSDQQLIDLAHHISSLDLEYEQALQGEQSFCYDIIQRIYTDDGNGDGRLTSHASQSFYSLIDGREDRERTEFMLSPIGLPAVNAVVASRKEMKQEYDYLMDKVVASFRAPYWSPDRFLDKDLKDLLRRNKIKYPLIHLLFPAFEATRVASERHGGSREGALIGISLELYKRQHGDWPKSLAELSPRYLPTLPVDRMTGQPLGYKIIEDRPVVYSVGTNKINHGGIIDNTTNGLVSHGHFYHSFQSGLDGDWILWMPLDEKLLWSSEAKKKLEEQQMIEQRKDEEGALENPAKASVSKPNLPPEPSKLEESTTKHR